ncbi:MAG: hypothetical protein ACJ789_10775 [Thermomicrobiales bacterium]
MQFHYRKEQRRAKFIVAAILAVVLIVGGTLVFLPDFRLSLGLRLGLVPGKDAEKLYAGSDPVELIVLVKEVPVQLTLPEKRYTAVYITERAGGQTFLHDLNRDRDVVVPLVTYDQVSVSDDHSALLFVDHTTVPKATAVLVTIETGAVRVLPPGKTDPGIPGDWETDIAGTAAIGCDAVSPSATWVGCISHGQAVSRFIFGSWDFRVSPYGNASRKINLYRGGGIDPIGGWNADEHWFYLQNEKGIVRIEMPPPE